MPLSHSQGRSQPQLQKYLEGGLEETKNRNAKLLERELLRSRNPESNYSQLHAEEIVLCVSISLVPRSLPHPVF